MRNRPFFGIGIRRGGLCAATIALLSGALCSCGERAAELPAIACDTVQPVPTGGWRAADTLVYALPRQPRDRDVRVRLGVRTSRRYALRNLELRATLEEVGPRVRHVVVRGGDTLNSYFTQERQPVQCVRVPFQVYDASDRASGSGRLFTYTSSQPLVLRLRANRRYQLRVTHLMRQNPLPGVAAVALGLADE